jgi:hypothetical protein
MNADMDRLRGGDRRLSVMAVVLWLAGGAGGCQATRAGGPDASPDGAAGAGGKGGGGGVAGGAGGAGGAANPLCANSAPFDRSCASDGDCVAGVENAGVLNGCPAAKYVGIRASELARFNAFQQACDNKGGCDFPPVPPEVDDGSPLYSGAQLEVTCQAGTCTTYSSSCGHVCGSGTSCFSCTTAAGSSFAACTARCDTSRTCQDPTLPSCQLTQFFEPPLTDVREEFCAPAGVVCYNAYAPRPDGGGSDARGDAAAD